MKTIPLTQGQVALVDDADYDAVNAHKWYALKTRYGDFYAARNILKPDGKRTVQRMHQFILPGVSQIDHRDGNKLNNQQKNLRPATSLQNQRGARRKKVGATSKFRGVTWDRVFLKWEARIGVGYKKFYLGRFTNEEDAARARDAAALKYHGEFAHLNFP